MADYSKTRIQFRRGTAAELSAANPKLGVGEPAFATDTNVLKIGDGSDNYNDLSGITGGGGGGGSMSNLTDDSSPQLGGDLDLFNKDITGTGDINITGDITSTSLIKSGGTSSQFLKADGSVDTSSYITSVTTSSFSASTLVTESEGIASNDNDTTIPTSAAVKDYIDTNVPSSDTSSIANSTAVTNIVMITQANYDALSSYDTNTVYFIT